MDEIEDTISKIKNFEIEGSGKIYNSLINSFKNFALGLDEKDLDGKNFIENLKKAREKINDNVYEVMTINTIDLIILKLEKNKNENLETLKKNLCEYVDKILKYKQEAEEKICEFASDLIFNDSKILTHCYSTTVLNSIKKAKEKGKNFLIINTETRPNFTGRFTSKFLSELNVKNVYIFDSEISRFINEIDFALIGCDAITEDGIINKIGSYVISIVANFHKKDVYVLTSSLKFSSTCKEKYMEKRRKAEEVWDIKDKSKINIENFAFDFVDKKFISAVISEYGKLSFEESIEKFKSKDIFNLL